MILYVDLWRNSSIYFQRSDVLMTFGGRGGGRDALNNVSM